MLKWLQNPKYYYINKKYNFENIIRISDCKKYRGKSTEIQRICDSLPLEFIYYIYGKDITINFSNLDNNCKLVCLIFQIRPWSRFWIIYCPTTMHIGVCNINKICFWFLLKCIWYSSNILQIIYTSATIAYITN